MLDRGYHGGPRLGRAILFIASDTLQRPAELCRCEQFRLLSIQSSPELDMDWIHPWIGLGWIGLDWIGSGF